MSEVSSYTAQKARKATQIKDESRAHLKALNVVEGRTVMAGKPEPSTLPELSDPVWTNIFSVKFKEDDPTRVYRYDLTIAGRVGGQDRYDFTRRAGSDVQIVGRKERCRAAFDFLVTQRQDILPARNQCVYDLQAILFTLVELKEFKNQDRLDFELPLTPEEANRQDSRGRAMYIGSETLHFVIKPVRNFDLVLSNDTVAQSISLDIEEQKSDLQQFIEILTSQNALTNAQQHVTFQGGRSYLLRPQDHGFDLRDYPDLGRGAYLAVGAQKSCKIVEGPARDRPRLTVVVENKKTPFHSDSSVEEKILSVYPQFHPQRDLSGATHLVKDLWVMTTYDQQPDFKIHGLVGSATANTFEHQGQQITVQNYYKGHLNIELLHPDWPLIVAKGRDGRQNFYPIEVCQICDNQRLTSTQLTPDQTSTIIRTCARPPRDQMRQIEQNFLALRVNAGASMEAARVAVGQNPIQLSGSLAPSPRIRFQNDNPNFDTQRGEWRPSSNARFLLPAQVECWAIYVHCPRRQFQENLLGQFVSIFVNRCTQQGMMIGEPAESMYVDSVENLRARFDRANSSSKKCNLFVVITDRRDLEIHQQLKGLEQEFDIVTQNVTSKIATESVQPGGGRLTLANVVNKTNMKCGGLNYAVYPQGYTSPLGDDDLFIGFGSNHPGGYASEDEKKIGGAPTVIGYAANDLEHPCAFSGDYIYAESRRDEKVGVIDQIVKTCVERFIKHRGKNPKRLFVFRNGCSEGQFPSILRYEIPLIEHVLKELNVDAGLTMIVPNRMHNVRLTPSNPRGQKAWEQNLPCGTAIDSVINHPKFFDFYLLSHIARQGTAKVPRYTVLYDTNKLSSDEAIVISYTLCFEHQIINGPTSFPTPVYIANRYSERGRMVYNVFQRTRLGQQPAVPSLEEYNKCLTYVNLAARNVRFNA